LNSAAGAENNFTMKMRLNSKSIIFAGFLAIYFLGAALTGRVPIAQGRPPAAPGQASEQNFSEGATGVAAKGKLPQWPLSQQQVRVRTVISRAQIKSEFSDLASRGILLASLPPWIEAFRRLWDSEGALFLAAVLFALLLGLLFRMRRFCGRYRDHIFFNRRPFLRFAFDLFRQTMPLFGITLFFYVYSLSWPDFSAFPAIELTVGILWIWLISRWYLDFVALAEQEQLFPGSFQVLAGLQIPIIWMRFLAIAHLITARIIGDHSAILMLGRMIFEAVFLVWYFRFSRHLRSGAGSSASDCQPGRPVFSVLAIVSGYIVIGGGLILDLMGLGSVSVYWLKSWAQTTVVLLWGGLFFLVLREWYLGLRQTSKTEDGLSQSGGDSFRWLFVWVACLAWLFGLLVAIIFAWGGKQALVLNFLKALNTPFQVGSMQLSIMGFIHGFLIILITHAAVRFWRRFFQKKVLEHSDIEVGLQESITTIAVYVFWGLGIVIALNAVGLNTTSLAVGLGALGIGLGFGLQNIFNNFVSGLILLFERPIQVGDAVEINGVWASVKKINFRATVVQTWDNASLIIPNSEFVSSQVTNWSFKDLRLRRNIIAGVAYGSDVGLVKETLLEIAAGHPRVLKEPEPDVLFSDFGDSALIFKLRVWTYVEGMLTVESDLRFEIDRRFRLNNITIAFPQRDIHIRSTAEPAQADNQPGSPEA